MADSSQGPTKLQVPSDANNNPLPLTPPVASLARTVDATISSATSVTLNAGTTLLEVSALAQGIFMKYAAGASAADFDEFIQAGATRHYVVPKGVTVVSFIEQASAATLVLIEK